MKKRITPSKSAITQAMQSPAGERIRRGTATLGDYVFVMLAAEALTQSERILKNYDRSEYQTDR